MDYCADDESRDFFLKYGHDVFGPLLLGFCRWLHDRAQEDGVNQLLFVARDGHVIKSAYEILYPDSADSNLYFYISRKSTLPTRINNASSVDEVLSNLHLRKRTSPSQLLNRLPFPEDVRKSLETDFSLNYEKPVPKNTFLKDAEYRAFVESLIKIVSDDERSNYLPEYIEQNVRKGIIGVVDVGWNGSTQSALVDIEAAGKTSNRSYKGYYFNVNDKKNRYGSNLDIAAYIYENGKPTHYDAKSSMGLLEFFLTAPHPTTIGYKVSDDSTILPVLGDYEFKNGITGELLPEDRALRTLHEGALMYVENNKSEIVSFDSATAPLFQLAQFPSTEELRMIGGLRFYEGGLHSLAAFERGKKEGFRFSDFFQSTWKLGSIINIVNNRALSNRLYKILLTVADK